MKVLVVIRKKLTTALRQRGRGQLGFLVIIKEKMMTMRARLGFLRVNFKRRYLTIDNLLLVVAATASIAWFVGSMSAMTRNWELAKRLETRKRTLALMKLEVETLELENQYYASKEYQELAARRQQDKIFPGEKMVILPPNTLAAKMKFKDNIVQMEEEPSNFAQWMMFLRGGKK